MDINRRTIDKDAETEVMKEEEIKSFLFDPRLPFLQIDLENQELLDEFVKRQINFATRQRRDRTLL